MSEQTVTRQHLAGLELALSYAEMKPSAGWVSIDTLQYLIAQASAAPEQEWSSSKPTACGAYWIRGNGLEAPALIEVKTEEGELWCNLHMRNTEPVFEYGYTVAQLSDEFEFSRPLCSYAETAEVERLRADLATELARVDAAVGDANDAERQLAEAQALLREIADDGLFVAPSYRQKAQSLLSAAQPADGVNSDE